MGLVGDGDGDGWVWSERLGFSGFQWGWAVAVEIGVAVKVGVGLGFVFTGLVGGGVFQGFCRGGWSVVEVEIGVAMEIVWPCLCFGDGDVSVNLVSCLWVLFFFMWICIFSSWIYWI